MPALAPDQVNSLLVKKLIQDLIIECTSATQVVIKQGSRAGADDGSVIMEAAGDLTLDITASGKNGLDTGAEASDTWYYLWMIFNPDTEEVAGLLSASATAPTLPSGFTKKRLVGAVRNDGSSNFIQFIQKNDDVDFFAVQTLLSAGSATSYTALSMAAMVPTEIAAHAYAQGWVDGTNGSAVGWTSLDGTNENYRWHLNVASTTTVTLATPATRLPFYNGQIYYRVSQGDDNLYIWILGYKLSL